MNENLDLVEILKDCPKGTKFYSRCLGSVEFCEITLDNYIKIIDKNGYYIRFKPNGIYELSEENAEIDLFPSKYQRDWSKWHRPFVDGDIVFVRTNVKNEFVSIYKEYRDGDCKTYFDLSLDSNRFFTGENNTVCDVDNIQVIRLATEEEKEKFFQAIKDNGYQWNAETKTLKKLVEQKFNDGDVVTTKSGLCTGIVRRHVKLVDDAYQTYIAINGESLVHDDNIFYFERLATEEEKQKLFKALEENGYKWNAETKTLEKIKKEKFDPKTLQPFDKVLTRDWEDQSWDACIYSHMKEYEYYPFTASLIKWRHCIPYNDDTKHLIGKTDEAPEFYRYWEN